MHARPAGDTPDDGASEPTASAGVASSYGSYDKDDYYHYKDKDKEPGLYAVLTNHIEDSLTCRVSECRGLAPAHRTCCAGRVVMIRTAFAGVCRGSLCMNDCPDNQAMAQQPGTPEFNSVPSELVAGCPAHACMCVVCVYCTQGALAAPP